MEELTLKAGIWVDDARLVRDDLDCTIAVLPQCGRSPNFCELPCELCVDAGCCGRS